MAAVVDSAMIGQASTFVPVAVESPGGGRIRDNRDPAKADLVAIDGLNKRVPVHRLAAQAWSAMVAAARTDGIASPLLSIVSGYRSSALQAQLYQRAVARYGSDQEARKWVAPPGASAHQSGRALDLYLGLSNDSRNAVRQRQLRVYMWLTANAGRFGFFPYDREPWHWEYNPRAAAGPPPPTASPPAVVMPPALPTPPAPVTPATAPGSAPPASAFTRATPPLTRVARLVPLLNKYRGEIPLEFLIGWIDVESAGRIDEVTPRLDERGFFQIHPDESHDRHFDHQRLTTDPEYSVQAGIENVRYYARLAQQRFPSIAPRSALFWRVVKLQHAMGSGLARALLTTITATGAELTWEAIKQAEVSRGPQLHRLLRVKPLGRFARNVDHVFARAAELAHRLGLGAAPAADGTVAPVTPELEGGPFEFEFEGPSALEFEGPTTPLLPTITTDPFPAPIPPIPPKDPTSPLQRCVDAIANPALGAAVVDITDPAHPVFAGRFEDDTFYVGSLDKIAPMYAAFELRVRVQRAVNEARTAGLDVTKPRWERPLLTAIQRRWEPSVNAAVAGMPASFPALGTIFDFEGGATAGHEVRFKRRPGAGDLGAVGEFGSPDALSFDEWLTLMVRWSNNTAADRVIRALGYSFINGALQHAGLFTPAPTDRAGMHGNGIWVSGSYGGHRWKPGVDPMVLSARGAAHYKATTNFTANARAVAWMLTLAATGRLFGTDLLAKRASDDMVRLMIKDEVCGNRSYFADALHLSGIATTFVSSKLGIGDPPRPGGANGYHDCAIVTRTSAGGHPIRYVGVGLGGLYPAPAASPGSSFASLQNLFVALDHCVDASH